MRGRFVVAGLCQFSSSSKSDNAEAEQGDTAGLGQHLSDGESGIPNGVLSNAGELF
jgi:hypothetical protein